MAGKTLKARRTSWIRRSVQIFFFVVIAAISVNHYFEESGTALAWLSSASLHSVCPFGGVVSIYQFLVTGTFVKKIHESSMILMGIVFTLGIFFGPVFCGWICPYGAFQEWISNIGKKIFKKRYNTFIPKKLDSVLRYARYLLLAQVIFMTAKSGVLVFAEADPDYALFNFWTGEVAIAGYIFLGATILLSLFVERPFCKYACPYGAVLGLTNLFRVFGIKRNKSTCISCKACDKACPMNIEVSTAGTVRNHQCISCMKCTSEQACPIGDTVVLGAGKFTETGAAERAAK